MRDLFVVEEGDLDFVFCSIFLRLYILRSSGRSQFLLGESQ